MISPGRRARSARRTVRCCWPLPALLCALAASPAGAAVTSGPSYVQVPGSPFAVGDALDSLAANPAGRILATADYGAGQLAVLSLDPASGVLTAATGSPFAAGRGPDAVAFSPNGSFEASTNLIDDDVAISSVSSAGVLAPVPGSPFPTGNSPRAVAFTPSGNLLAIANESDDSVSVFDVGSGGGLTEVAGSPFTTGFEPVALSFSPNGGLLAVANEGAGTVSVFDVDREAGSLTPSAGSPITAGDGPAAVAFSPSGNLLAVADSLSNAVSIFTTGASASAFVPAPGSPFATGEAPESIAFGAGGGLLATADSLDGTLAVFDVSANGSISLVQGAPFAAGNAPHSVAFVPNSSFIAVASSTDGTVSVLEPAPPPTVSVAVPASGQAYIVGKRVRTQFSCADSSGPGISSCQDGSGARAPSGLLDTKQLGHHTYTVTALSADGLTATATVSYVVAPVPPALVKRPQVSGAVRRGHLLRCSAGRWRGRPTRYSYQWERGGVALADATTRSYRVRRLDEGSELQCGVTASNGSSTQALSSGLAVPLAATPACPAPSGELSGAALGPLKLGDTRAQAARASGGAKESSSHSTEQFCLSPAGITVGFPDQALRKLLGAAARPSHIAWALTANPHYSYNGVGPGLALDSAVQRLGSGTVRKRGREEFYFVRGPRSTIVVVARGSIVTTIGVAANRVTGNSAVIGVLVDSFAASGL